MKAQLGHIRFVLQKKKKKIILCSTLQADNYQSDESRGQKEVLSTTAYCGFSITSGS